VVSVVAPVTAVTAAVVPVVGGLLLGELISGPAVLGVLVGAAAVGLLSFAPGSVLPEEPPRAWVAAGGRRPAPVPPGRRVRRAALLALGAGTSFGAFFLLVDRTGEAAGFWPLAAARATSIPLMAVAALVLGRSLRLAERSTWRLVVVAGALDMVANLSFLLATRRGAVGVVAVLVALAPAATLALARLVLHERVRRLQAAGLALAGLAVVLIAVA
jgi:drug/metabolite transporter (DMT)-like permease